MRSLTLPSEQGRPMAEALLIAWLADADPGDQIVYWRGWLAHDTCAVRNGLTEIERKRLSRIAQQAWRMCEAGQAHLVQRRVSVGVFDYIAIARPKPRRTPTVKIMEAA
jgi:hypothetical protein